MSIIKKEKNYWQIPIDALAHLRGEVNKLFDRTLACRPRRSAFRNFNFFPEVDMLDKGKEVVLEVDLPGLEKGEIDIQLQGGNMLIVRGERKEEGEKRQKNAYYMERRFGSFIRAIELPCKVKESDVKAQYKGGVLRISVPKCESAETKKITVNIK